MIRFGNLVFKYKNKKIFDNFNLSIKDNVITTIIGPNGCGKSTLMKILVGLLPYEGTVTIDSSEVKDNVNALRAKIGYVAEKPDNQIVNEVVYDEIAYVLRNLGIEEGKIIKEVHKVANLLDIADLLDKNVSDLNTTEKQLVCIASALLNNPKILILDESLSILDPLVKENIVSVLKKLKTQMTIIHITHDIEDTLYSDAVVVMNNGNVILSGTKEDIYASEKVLNDLGYKLPFMVELSNRLMFYGLIDHVIYDMKEMVDVLWQ